MTEERKAESPGTGRCSGVGLRLVWLTVRKDEEEEEEGEEEDEEQLHFRKVLGSGVCLPSRPCAVHPGMSRVELVLVARKGTDNK